MVTKGLVRSFSLFRGMSLSWLLAGLLLMLIVKFPVFVLHGWLPRAHVEAPTVGSVLLARVLLKLGSYGILRIVLYSALTTSKLFVIFGLGGALAASVLCFVQTDFKALIAISSVAHISSLWAATSLARERRRDVNILVSISHGFVSAALFFFVGEMYEHRGRRSLLLLRDTPSFTLVSFFS